MEIKQHTQAWHQSKADRIGGSEIYSLVHYYCAKELEQLGIDLVKDQPFQSAFEIYVKVKLGIKEDNVSTVNSEFGRGMEDYIVNRLNSAENDDLDYEGSDGFIINEEIHKLACCSPDGYLNPKDGFNVRDFDDKTSITKNMGRGTLELKTTPYGFNFESEIGTKFQYIFQLQYNMIICGDKWGMLACISPKEKEFDTDFFKGKIIGCLQTIKGVNPELKGLDNIDKYYNLYTYLYATIKPIQDLCLLALERFESALDNDLYPIVSKGNKAKLLREKKLLACIYPEKFDSFEADQTLDNLLNERNETAIELLKIQTAKEALDCEIIEKMQDHIEVTGTAQKAKFDKRGTLRFNQIRK